MEKLIIKEPFGTYVIAQKPITKTKTNSGSSQIAKNKNIISIQEIQNSIENEAYQIKLKNQIRAADDFLANFFKNKNLDHSSPKIQVKQEVDLRSLIQPKNNNEKPTIKRSISIVNTSSTNLPQKTKIISHNLIHKQNKGSLQIPIPPQKIRHLSSSSNLSENILLSAETPGSDQDQIFNATNGNPNATIIKRSSDGTMITSSGRTILPVKDRPFRCPHPSKKDPTKPCPSAFMRADELKRHIKIHNPNKPYKCSFCDMRFSRTDHLTTHTRTHTKEKPYQCQYPGCDKKFARSDERLRHHAVHENRLKKQRSQMEQQEREKRETLKKQQTFTTMPNLSFTNMLRPQGTIGSAPIQLKLSSLNGNPILTTNQLLKSPISKPKLQVSSHIKQEIAEDN